MGRFFDFISGKSTSNEIISEPKVEQKPEVPEIVEEKNNTFLGLNYGKKKKRRK